MSKIEVNNDLIERAAVLMHSGIYHFFNSHFESHAIIKAHGLNAAMTLLFMEITQVMDPNSKEENINFLAEINMHFEMYMKQMRERFINKN